MDVYHPVSSTGLQTPPPGGWPLVVAIPGGPAAPGGRGGLSPLASALAIRGTVVVLADWRQSPEWGGGYPASFRDVACAIRMARKVAGDYGADPSKVTLVAHSFGGFAGAVVALSPTSFDPPAGQCLAAHGSDRPDAYVGIAPVSILDDIGGTFLPTFFGGNRADRPAAWSAADPVALADKTAPAIPIRLVVGLADSTVPPATVAPLEAALRAAGRDVEVVQIDGAAHQDILVRPQTLSTVISVSGP